MNICKHCGKKFKRNSNDKRRFCCPEHHNEYMDINDITKSIKPELFFDYIIKEHIINRKHNQFCLEDIRQMLKDCKLLIFTNTKEFRREYAKYYSKLR